MSLLHVSRQLMSTLLLSHWFIGFKSKYVGTLPEILVIGNRYVCAFHLIETLNVSRPQLNWFKYI